MKKEKPNFICLTMTFNICSFIARSIFSECCGRSLGSYVCRDAVLFDAMGNPWVSKYLAEAKNALNKSARDISRASFCCTKKIKKLRLFLTKVAKLQ